jgi:thiol:disulfide interchange protein
MMIFKITMILYFKIFIIKMENSKNNFDNFIKKEVDNFEAQPSENVWQKLDGHLAENSSKIPQKNNWLLFAATIVAGVILFGLLFLYLKNKKQPVAKPDSTSVFANYQSTDVFQMQQIKSAVTLMEDQNKKIVLINCQMNSCPMCAKMENLTYENYEIAGFLDKYFVKIDVEFSANEMTQLQDFYRLKAYPTALFLDRNGVLLEKVVGFQDAEKFMDTLDNMMELEAMGQLVFN